AHTQLIAVFHLLPVQIEDHIASLQTRSRRRSSRSDIAYQDTFGLLRVQRLSHRGRNILRQQAQITAHHFAVIHYLSHHAARQIRRNRKAHALVSAIVGENGRVNSDQLSPAVQEG